MSANDQTPHYSIVIEWSEDDQAFVVLLPEWPDQYAMPIAEGATYEEAIASQSVVDFRGRKKS